MSGVTRAFYSWALLCALCLAALPGGTARAQRRSEKAAETTASARPAAEPAEEDREKEEESPRMRYRLIGPYRGGRALTAVGIAGNPGVYYFGAVAGGVWKSTNGGAAWNPIFDKQDVSSIGSVALAPSDPNVLYVGTGEACIRGDISYGDGMYKSLDGGRSWTHIGLNDTRAIGKVMVHPHNPNIVFVAALGHPYGPNPERGIFRTSDGGKTWEKVLYKDENTGGIDITFDPNNPNILWAALWQARRTPYSLSSGGPGSGLYHSADGGTTWKRLQGNGLPPEPWGRAGVAVGANSDRVYALIEAQEGGLYRSDDGGNKWELVNPDHRFTQRAWYYMHVVADPRDANTLYILNVNFFRSTDGGRTFNKIKVPHGDNHGLWIDPLNTKRMIQANDGGVTISLDGGKSWTREDNQPTAQFYHVITDSRFPYWVYGAQQDNSTVGIASRGDSGHITQADWYDVGGGESGYIAPYPPDAEIVYAGGYEAEITRFDKHTGDLKEISVYPAVTDALGADKLAHRFQWTAPLFLSPHDPNVLYHAGERLFQSTDGGMHWEAISPDLTRNDKSKQQASGGPITLDGTGTEYYDTIFAATESALQKGLIWAGTDDGLVQLTRDGGKSWKNVTPKDLPEWGRISQIEASPHDAGTAYVAANRYQLDDPHPYIYKTSGYGQSWTKLTNGLPANSYVRVVREDPKKKGLLYAGTETGVFVSYNDGAQWESLQLNLPTAPVHDLVIHGNDLVLATHGRSFWILDDVGPLRQHKDAVEQQEVHLYAPSAAYRLHNPKHFDKPILVGENPPPGATIYFNLKSVPKDEVTLEILDAKGEVVRKVSSKQNKELDEPLDPDDEKPKKQLPLKPGLNRYVWDLRYQSVPRLPDYYLYEQQRGTEGPLALPGQYQVRLSAAGKTVTEPLELMMDPRSKAAMADLEKQFTLVRQIQAELTQLYRAVAQVKDLRWQNRELRQRLTQNSAARLLLTASDELDRKMGSVQDELMQAKISANEDSLRYPYGLDGRLAFLASYVASDSDSAPTQAAYAAFDQLKKETDEQLARWSGVLTTDVAEFQKLLAEQNVRSPLVVPQAAATVGAGSK